MKRLSLDAATVFVVSLAISLACGTPTPVPDPPGPTPDAFTGAVVDCSLLEVVSESPGAESAVRACIVGETVASCLVELTRQYRVDTIACVVRDLGDLENRRALSGNVGSDSTTIDNAARAWIQAERLGYR